MNESKLIGIKEEIIKEKKWFLKLIRFSNKKNSLVEGAFLINIEKPLENSIKILEKDLIKAKEVKK